MQIKQRHTRDKEFNIIHLGVRQLTRAVVLVKEYPQSLHALTALKLCLATRLIHFVGFAYFILRMTNEYSGSLGK